MGKEWNETLCLVIKPLLIAKEEVDDHHRCAKETVIKVLLKDAELH
jgi:hypothetical protein